MLRHGAALTYFFYSLRIFAAGGQVISMIFTSYGFEVSVCIADIIASYLLPANTAGEWLRCRRLWRFCRQLCFYWCTSHYYHNFLAAIFRRLQRFNYAHLSICARLAAHYIISYTLLADAALAIIWWHHWWLIWLGIWYEPSAICHYAWPIQLQITMPRELAYRLSGVPAPLAAAELGCRWGRSTDWEKAIVAFVRGRVI